MSESMTDVATFVTVDPRTDTPLAEFPAHSAHEVAAQVARARDAATWWSGLGYAGRARRLKRWRQHLLHRFDELAEVVSAETGKPLADAKIEVVLGIDHLHWAAQNAERVLRRRRVAPGMLMFNHIASVEYTPLGVVGVIGPWNYPVFTPMGSIAYALAAGNAVVFKPSEYTTRVGQWLVNSLADVLAANRDEKSPLLLVTGAGKTGATLCRANIDKLAFTGSTPTGKRVMAACAESLTPVLMECGGKDAFIVDADADLKAAADAAVWGSLSNAGQTCVGAERVFVADQVAAEFTALVTGLVGNLSVGGSTGADIGPITMPGQIDVIERHIRDGLSSGGQALIGSALSVQRPYVKPVVLVDVPDDSAACTEETFGPVIIINRVRTMDEAIERANSTAYGLGATVFSRSQGTRIADRLNVGMVGVNSFIPYTAIPSLPFGGVGQSGFGRIHGDDGLREFAHPKSIARKVGPALLRPTSFTRPPWTIPALTVLAKILYRW
jgi:acyl-CoA reductase-like NAD-dependent aldehyde dehydrogenase